MRPKQSITLTASDSRRRPGRRIHTSTLAVMVVVGLLATACGDFFEEEAVEDPPEAPAIEAPTRERPDVPTGSYSSPELGSFSFQETNCPFEPESPLDIDCGVLTVPESRTGLSDATIELAVAILRTPSSSPAADPVVYLNGGPGGVSLAEHWWWVSEPGQWQAHPILVNRDLILIDQRGTGYSLPSLNCDEEELIDECHERLVASGVTLAAYSTPENAADLASLRMALGYDQWNLYGSSYGTRLAMAIVRDHPEGVRSMLLDGVYPLDVVPAYEMFFDNTLHALDEVVALCASQPACAQAYGDVGDLLIEAIEVADSDPQAPFDGMDVFDLVFQAMYSMESLIDVPYALWLIAIGEYDAALELLDAEPTNGLSSAPRSSSEDVSSAVWLRALDPSADSTGMFYSVECREEQAFTDMDVVDAQYDALSLEGVPESVLSAIYGSIYNPAVEICPGWDSGVAHDDERDPLVSDVASLLLAGRFDPITPPRWAEIAAAGLTGSTLIVSPSLSHSTVGEDACVDGIIAIFLDDPATVLDTSCVVNMLPPAVTLPS